MKYFSANLPESVKKLLPAEEKKRLGIAALTLRELTAPPASERELHEQIINVCKERGWICFTGSMAHKTRRTIGESDFTCLLPNGQVLFVECKSKTGKLTPGQRAMKVWMEMLGHEMHVIDSLKSFLSICDRASSEASLAGSRSLSNFTGPAK